MFNATLNRLPPPPFVPEHQPLRLTSDAQRPLPAGECRFLLPHPQTGRCPCQSFHHNRSIPGSTCDCGHQACYHASVQEESVQPASAVALESRIRQLETDLRLERQLRERDVRVLREAFYPFYQHFEVTRGKVTELEDRIESNYDEQVRLHDRVVALDDSGMALEKRVDDMEGSTSKRRRISRAVTNGDGSSRRLSDDLSVSHSSHVSGPVTFIASRSISPTGQHITGHGTLEYSSMAAPPEREGPRSSGILNLVQLSRNPRYNETPPYNDVPSQRISPPREVEEARSSGFLALDLAERLARRGRGDAAGSRVANTSAPPGTLASPESSSGDDKLGKRKRDAGGLGALDVLANVSAVSAMAR